MARKRMTSRRSSSAFGPRPPASDAIHKTQDYIIAQLKSFGCAVDTDDFHSQTPIGDIAMKNIIAKIPGTGQGIILLLTHYDTLRLDGFVGAEDGGSSTGLMLEMARNLCGTARSSPIRSGSRFSMGKKRRSSRMARRSGRTRTASMAAGNSPRGSLFRAILKRVRAVLLADMVGQKNLQIPRESRFHEVAHRSGLEYCGRASATEHIFESGDIPWMTITMPFHTAGSCRRGHHRSGWLPSAGRLAHYAGHTR